MWWKPSCLAIATIALSLAGPARAQEPKRSGPWILESTASGNRHIAEMTLHASPEPKPALKLRLTPDPFDQVEGNSALFYLKAMGFLEQTYAAQGLRDFQARNRKLAAEKGLPESDLPPYSWLEIAPAQLPLAEVKEYLQYMAFQPPLLAEATLRTRFSLDRNTRQVESPVAILLPEIQTMRELSRVQSLRCRVAIAEHRIDDAIAILKQQVTMARHLGSDEFLVSNLVGLAILSVALQDAIYLQQEPGAPNLYWAFASLPRPLVDFRESLSMERQFTSMQLKALRDVDEAIKPAGYWNDFINRILPQIRELDLYDRSLVASDPQAERAALVGMIAASYPGAKRYLLEECHMDRAKVDAYPTAQTVFLAMKQFNERTVDEQFKWLALPYEQARQHPEFLRLDKARYANSQRVGWLSAPCNLLMAGISNIRTAQIRAQQQMALLQTIEAIRMYSAAHPGKLPASLADLPYPAPNDPFDGQPFDYQVTGDQATLTGEQLPNLQYQFKLRLAQP